MFKPKDRIEPPPKWLGRSLAAAWSAFEGSEILSSDLARLSLILALIESDDLPEPAIAPGRGKQIVATWWRGDRELQINVRGGRVQVRRVYPGGETHIPANDHRPDLAKLIRGEIRTFFGKAINASSETDMDAEITHRRDA